MKKIKNLTLKIIATFLGTIFVSWICFLIYSYELNVQNSSWEGAMLMASISWGLQEFLVVWMVFGYDIVSSNEC
jgi:hypothetical protein